MKTYLINIMGVVALLVAMSACTSQNDSIDDYFKEVTNSEYAPLYDDTNGMYIMVNTKGSTVSERGFHRLGYLHSGLAWSVTSDSTLVGFVDAKGVYKIKPKYAVATDFSGGLAIAAEPKGLLEVIDTKGNVKFALPADAYMAMAPLNGVIAYITLQKMVKLMSIDGKPICPNLEIQDNNYLGCNGKYLAYNTEMGNPEIIRISDGKPILQSVTFDQIEMVNSNREAFKICCDSKWGVINSDGKFIINPSYNAMIISGDMYMAITDDNKLCWYNSKGEMVIKPKYKEVSKNFGFDDYAIVSTNGKTWTVIDRAGEQLFTKRFDQIIRAIDNHFFVKKDSKWGIVNSKGEYTVDPQFEQVSAQSRVLLASPADNGPSAVISIKGEYLTDRLYSDTGFQTRLIVTANKPDAGAIAALAQKLASEISIGQTIETLPFQPSDSQLAEYVEYCDGMLCLDNSSYYDDKVKVAIYSNFENGGIKWRYYRGKYRPELVPTDVVSLYCVTLDFSKDYELGEEVYKILSKLPNYKLQGTRPDKVDSFTIQCETPDQFKLYALDSSNPTYEDEDY